MQSTVHSPQSTTYQADDVCCTGGCTKTISKDVSARTQMNNENDPNTPTSSIVDTIENEREDSTVLLDQAR